MTGKNLEGSGSGIIEMLFQNLAGRIERGIKRKVSAKMAGVPAEVRTEHLPNTNLDHCLWNLPP
jgi:hypothetical protein